MKRRIMTLAEVREISTYYTETRDNTAGICCLVDVYNMGWCKDGYTRFYCFNDEDGQPAIFFKYFNRGDVK